MSAELKSYVQIMEDVRADNARHAKQLERPEGFFEIRKYGRFIAYGFYCSKCRVEFLGVKETSIITHCGGKKEQIKTGLAGFIQSMGLKSRDLPE